jgi:hypothetical protein
MPIYKMVWENKEWEPKNIDEVKFGGETKTSLLNEISFDLEITFPLVNGRYHEITLDLANDLRFTNSNIKYINWNDTESKIEPYVLSGINKHVFKNNSTTIPKKVYNVHIYLTTKSYIYEAFEDDLLRILVNSNTYVAKIKVANVLYRYTQV